MSGVDMEAYKKKYPKTATNRGLKAGEIDNFFNVSLVYRFNRWNYFEYEIWWLDD
jgi:hypothetical protein